MKTTKIGNQEWMAENLKVTKYRNGDAIPNVKDVSRWAELSNGAYCNYNNQATDATQYGRLYNWYAVHDPRGLAPEDWHVPSADEWRILFSNLGGNTVRGDEGGTIHRLNYDTVEESGLFELPGAGLRDGGRRDGYGNFLGRRRNTNFWSSTDHGSSNAWAMVFVGSEVYCDAYHKRHGLLVRCVRD